MSPWRFAICDRSTTPRSFFYFEGASDDRLSFLVGQSHASDVATNVPRRLAACRWTGECRFVRVIRQI
jgi:hypothetical protein